MNILEETFIEPNSVKQQFTYMVTNINNCRWVPTNSSSNYGTIYPKRTGCRRSAYSMKSRSGKYMKTTKTMYNHIYQMCQFRKVLGIEQGQDVYDIFDNDQDGYLNEDDQILILSTVKEKMQRIGQQLRQLQMYEQFRDLMKEVRYKVLIILGNQKSSLTRHRMNFDKRYIGKRQSCIGRQETKRQMISMNTIVRGLKSWAGISLYG